MDDPCIGIVVALLGNPLVDLLVAIVALCGLIAVVGMLRGSSLYDRIGQDGPFPEPTPHPTPRPGTPAARAERDLEIRQMLQARNDRRVRSGHAPLDIDAELSHLLAGPASMAAGTTSGQGSAEEQQSAADLARHDPQLVDELRQLAEARNQRRLRRGEEPLDVRAEVRRALAELDI